MNAHSQTVHSGEQHGCLFDQPLGNYSTSETPPHYKSVSQALPLNYIFFLKHKIIHSKVTDVWWEEDTELQVCYYQLQHLLSAYLVTLVTVWSILELPATVPPSVGITAAGVRGWSLLAWLLESFSKEFRTTFPNSVLGSSDE